MQAKSEKEYSLLKTDNGIYGLYTYHSTWTSASGPLNDPESQRQNNIVAGFKNRGHNTELFSRRIKQVALLLNCTRIVAVPPHDLKQSNIQKLFPGNGIIRTTPGPKRKYKKNELSLSHFSISDTKERTLLVDDLSTTGYTLKFFANSFQDCELFAIGINAKLNPRTVRMLQDQDIKPQPEIKPEDTGKIQVDNVSDRVAFIAALQNGMGLTHGCRLIQWHPKEMSALLIREPEFRKECEHALKFASKALLVMSNSFLENKKFDKWLHQNEYIKAFHTDLNVWECYRRRELVTDIDLINGFRIFGSIGELATSTGFTGPELIEHIATNKRLSIYFTEIGVLK